MRLKDRYLWPDFNFRGGRTLKGSKTVREKMITVLIIKTATMIAVIIMSSSFHNKDWDYDGNSHNKDCDHGKNTYFE